MAITDIVRGSKGVQLIITATQDGDEVDISGFTTLKTIIIEAPDTTKHTLTATFVTNGQNGQIQATTSTGISTFDQSGGYKLRAHIQSPQQDIYSKSVSFDVEDMLE